MTTINLIESRRMGPVYAPYAPGGTLQGFLTMTLTRNGAVPLEDRILVAVIAPDTRSEQ